MRAEQGSEASIQSVSRAVEWNGMVRFDGRSFITNDVRSVRSAVRWQPVDAGILASWRAGAGPGGVRSCTGSQPMEQVINVKPPPPPARTATLIRASTGAHRQTDRHRHDDIRTPLVSASTSRLYDCSPHRRGARITTCSIRRPLSLLPAWRSG